MTAGDGSGREPNTGTGPTGGAGTPGDDTTDDEGGTEAADRVTLRLVMPDRWLEQVEELPVSSTVEEAKALGLRKMLQRDTDDPDHFYVEYAERQVPDETVTLDELGVRPREILSIRAYDLGHYPRFEG